MSTVLWCNTLINNQLSSDESDKYFLYKHTKKLDKLCKSLSLPLFSSVQDCSDMEVNLGVIELPESMKSTDELMINSGVWLKGFDAVELINKIINSINSQNIKFGLIKSNTNELLLELEESLIMAENARIENGLFNFSVVM